MKRIDLAGQQFGKLTVLKFSHTINGQAFWECQCSCGNKTTVLSANLRRGHSKSCGCLKYHPATHGMSRSRLYAIWRNMLARCENHNNKHYTNYGARGITVCAEWHNFVSFRDWAISSGYADDLTIDRIDVNDNYEPNNCRWATMRAQQNNRRDNLLLTFNGKTQSLSLWAEEAGISKGTLFYRIDKLGWSAEQALTEPLHHVRAGR